MSWSAGKRVRNEANRNNLGLVQVGVLVMQVCKAPWGLRLGCEFVHLTDCETTWITMSFTICQEVLTEQRRGAPDQALRDLQEEGEDHELRWCLT